MSTLKRISALTALLALAAPTLAAPKISAQSIIVNPTQPELNVQVWTNRDASGDGNPVYQIGERISVGVKTNADAYLYLFNVNADGNIDLFFPNAYEDSNYVPAGTRVFPGNGARYSLSVGGPNGQDKLLAVVSTTELSLNDIAIFEGQQNFATVSVQGQDGLAQALSIVVNPLPDNAWVTDTAFFRVGNVAQTPQPQPTPVTRIQPGQREDGSFDSAMVDAYARLKGASRWVRPPPTPCPGATAGGRSLAALARMATQRYCTPTAAAARTRCMAACWPATCRWPRPRTAPPSPRPPGLGGWR